MLNRFRVTGFIHFSIYTSSAPDSPQSHALYRYSPAASTRASMLALCTALVAAGGFSDKNFRIFLSLCENPDILEISIGTLCFCLLGRNKFQKWRSKGCLEKVKSEGFFTFQNQIFTLYLKQFASSTLKNKYVHLHTYDRLKTINPRCRSDFLNVFVDFFDYQSFVQTFSLIWETYIFWIKTS